MQAVRSLRTCWKCAWPTQGKPRDAIEAMPDGGWSRTCTIAGSKPLTLKFALEDYMNYMREHLRHMKVEVNDLV